MRNERGFSLIEVLAGSAIFVFIALAAFALMKYSSLGTSVLGQSGEARSMIDEMLSTTRLSWGKRLGVGGGNPPSFVLTPSPAFTPGSGCNDLLIRSRDPAAPGGIRSITFRNQCQAGVTYPPAIANPHVQTACPATQMTVTMERSNFPAENVVVEQKRFPPVTITRTSISLCFRQAGNQLWGDAGSVVVVGEKGRQMADTLYLTTIDQPVGVQLLPN